MWVQIPLRALETPVGRACSSVTILINGGPHETRRLLQAYSAAWLAGDSNALLASYHDDIELRYMGTSPLAGSHLGRDAAFAALGQASLRTLRSRRVRRVLL